MAFGIAGNTFQTMLRNPLASPDIIGVTSGSSVAACLLYTSIGTYTYKNNDIYKGHFINNKKEGKGVLYYKDGSKYIGCLLYTSRCV